MSFSIEFVGPTDTPRVALGRIEIGDFSEHFQIDLSFWNQVMYESQWQHGIARLLDGAETSCLIQSLSNPEAANFIFWWPMYRLTNDLVAMQNGVLMLEELGETFDASDPYRFLRPRRTVTEDGARISEWSISLAELAAFHEKLVLAPRP